MCGILGILNFDGKPIDPMDLRLMADRMVRRGPDDEGFWVNGVVGLGMRRLSIIDLAGGHQPISNETGEIQVVMNGEIYNFAELRSGLIGRGHRFSTRSDVEVLVHLYEEMGRDCIQLLNGMFAFALYDNKLKTLWIARDRLGIKPLYYFRSSKKFAFASDLSALNATVRAPVSTSALVTYLGYSYVPAPLSIYENIQKLMPAEEIVICEGGSKNRIYWRLGESETWQGNMDKAIESAENIIADAIRLELQSDVPLGVFLSGGIDSSAVASFAAEHVCGEPLQTFTIDFIDKSGEDSRFAESFSKKLGSTHREFKISSEDLFSSLQHLIPMLDEPMADTAIVPTFLLSRAARENGVKVLLSGAGGDEIFGGYPRHFSPTFGNAGWFAALPSFLRRIIAPSWLIYNPALAIRLKNPERNFAVSISGANLELLRGTLMGTDYFEDLLRKFESDFRGAGSRRAYPLMKLDLQHFLPDNILPLTDKATMAASVEARVPLLDHRLVEFLFSLPESMNILGGGQKGFFRKMLEPRLPPSILGRSKEGFNAPIQLWAEKWTKEIRDELFENTSSILDRLINQKVLKEWIVHPRMRKKSGDSLYAIFILNRWLNTHEGT